MQITRRTMLSTLLSGLPAGWVGGAYASDAPETTNLRFGIIASLRKRAVKCRGTRRVAWQLDITDRVAQMPYTIESAPQATITHKAVMMNLVSLKIRPP